MKRSVIVLACIVVATALDHGLAGASPPCSADNGVNSCNRPHKVIVTGYKGPKLGPGDAPTASTGKVGIELVSTKWLTCSRGAEAELRALGDRSPAADMGTPCSARAIATCARSGAADRVARAQSVVLVRQRDGSWQYGGAACRQIGRPAITADLVRERIARLVPTAEIGVAPRQATLVNIQTIMWVDAPQRRALAPLTILGRRVVVTLRFDHVDWDFGDGHGDAADEVGKAYDAAHDPCRTVTCPDYYGHIYRQTGSMRLAATASWSASFTVDGGASVAIPATVAGPTARTTLRVRQARGVLVPDPQQH